MQLDNGTILDATAIIDFLWLNEWEWLKQNYSPLYVAQEVLDSDNLELPTREAARENLTPLNLDTEEMYVSFLEFRDKAPLLSVADRSTLALARHQLLLCASDDKLMTQICEEYKIPYTRTLRLLTEMVKTRHKTSPEVKEMTNILIEERGKRIAPKVLDDWHNQLRDLGNG